MCPHLLETSMYRLRNVNFGRISYLTVILHFCNDWGCTGLSSAGRPRKSAHIANETDSNNANPAFSRRDLNSLKQSFLGSYDD